MIIKNEEPCIARCLNSLKSIIDFWVISDTGSTDNSEQIVKETLKDIPGIYLKNDWVNFAENRNIALDEAKKHADYILIMDADDLLIIENENNFNKLDEDIYSLKIKYGPLEYSRPMLISSKVDCKFVCPVHEYLEISSRSKELFNGAYVSVTNDGNRSQDPLKYIKDAELLEKALEEDGGNTRYLFYCAQSYRDADILDKAAKYYEKRIVAGGWDQEVYVACLEAGKIYEKINNEKVEETYLKGWNKLKRIEVLYYLARYFRLKEQYEKAYFYAMVGVNYGMPKDGLFIEHEIYQWKIMDEAAISAYYIANKQVAIDYNKALLSRVPEWEKDRINNNLLMSLVLESCR